MTATATLACPDGCFQVTYRGSIDDPDTSDREFLNELGVPTKVARGDGVCPNCGTSVSIDWGDD